LKARSRCSQNKRGRRIRFLSKNKRETPRRKRRLHGVLQARKKKYAKKTSLRGDSKGRSGRGKKALRRGKLKDGEKGTDGDEVEKKSIPREPAEAKTGSRGRKAETSAGKKSREKGRRLCREKKIDNSRKSRPGRRKGERKGARLISNKRKRRTSQGHGRNEVGRMISERPRGNVLARTGKNLCPFREKKESRGRRMVGKVDLLSLERKRRSSCSERNIRSLVLTL